MMKKRFWFRSARSSPYCNKATLTLRRVGGEARFVVQCFKSNIIKYN